MWVRIEPLMLADPVRGRRWANHRRTLEAIAWKYRTCSPWRDLPDELGSFQTAHKRLIRWAVDGTWERILTAILASADAGDDVSWTVSVDSTVWRAHQHAAGQGKGGGRPVRTRRSRTWTLSRGLSTSGRKALGLAALAVAAAVVAALFLAGPFLAPMAIKALLVVGTMAAGAGALAYKSGQEQADRELVAKSARPSNPGPGMAGSADTGQNEQETRGPFPRAPATGFLSAADRSQNSGAWAALSVTTWQPSCVRGRAVQPARSGT